ncbi:MAG: cheB [Frankiales bacterium]|nr:cheB [Frankiales bacterium]
MAVPDQPDLAVVALVCSLGGAAALIEVLGALPEDFPAAVVALQHLDPRTASTLTQRLDAASPLRVRWAADGARLARGTVDVAPPGHHVLLARHDTLLLVDSTDQGRPRPSADLLLASMAAVLGPRLLAVVLTGTGEDGAVGAQVVARYGGRTLVQDRATAQAYGMPGAAVLANTPDPPVALTLMAAAIIAALRTGHATVLGSGLERI